MMLPPQKWPWLFCSDTCHGQLCGIASTPPTTRTLTLGDMAGRPHSATPGGTATPPSPSPLGGTTTGGCGPAVTPPRRTTQTGFCQGLF